MRFFIRNLVARLWPIGPGGSFFLYFPVERLIACLRGVGPWGFLGVYSFVNNFFALCYNSGRLCFLSVYCIKVDCPPGMHPGGCAGFLGVCCTNCTFVAFRNFGRRVCFSIVQCVIYRIYAPKLFCAQRTFFGMR